jgi:hypothetical protein
MAKKIKLPTDTNKRAKSIVDALTSDDKDTIEPTQEEKLSAAQLLGRQGGLASAAALSKKKRVEIAKKAAAARWGHKEDKLFRFFYKHLVCESYIAIVHI